MFYNYIMNNESMCELVKKKNSINEVLTELDQMMSVNNEILEDIRDYKKNLDKNIFNTDNEFANLSELEISIKLDRTLDDILNNPSNIKISQECDTFENLNNTDIANMQKLDKDELNTEK